jgi:DNA-binding response OmpR family regulator
MEGVNPKPRGLTMKNVSILIVEEEAIIAADLASKVEQMGFQVIGTAFTTGEAVEFATRMCPQLALLEANLKGEFNGIQAAKVIQELCNHLPVIFLTCDPVTMSVIDRAELTGPYGCISKPFEKRDLVSQIENVLENRSSCQRQR